MGLFFCHIAKSLAHSQLSSKPYGWHRPWLLGDLWHICKASMGSVYYSAPLCGVGEAWCSWAAGRRGTVLQMVRVVGLLAAALLEKKKYPQQLSLVVFRHCKVRQPSQGSPLFVNCQVLGYMCSV